MFISAYFSKFAQIFCIAVFSYRFHIKYSIHQAFKFFVSDDYAAFFDVPKP